jgi:hypothetical protein
MGYLGYFNVEAKSFEILSEAVVFIFPRGAKVFTGAS